MVGKKTIAAIESVFREVSYHMQDTETFLFTREGVKVINEWNPR